MNNTNQKCPHCGEENPAEAVMCWTCYTPLRAGKASAPRPEPVPAVEKRLGDKVKRWISDAVPYAGTAGLVANGWLPRKMRLSVLGASLSVLFGPMLLDELKNRFAKDKTDDSMRSEAEKPPAARIAETILYYALKEKSIETRIVENGQSVRINYQIEGEWHEQMIIPRYVWQPIRQYLLRYARRGEFDLTMSNRESENHKPLKLIKFRAHLETNAQNETLCFQFESAPLEAATGAVRFDDAPDVECLQCHESNVFDAVWCWNCGANLRQQTSARDKKYPILSALLFVGLAIAASSGWWTRRARWPILGAGASLIASPFAYDKWDNQRESREKKRIEDDKHQTIDRVYETSSADLVNSVLARAIQEKLPAIRLQECGNVIVSYEIDEQWRQDKILPGSTWLALRTDLLNRARGKVTCQGREYRFHAELNVDVSGEILVLRFDEVD